MKSCNRALLVYKEEYPWDVRVEKIAEALKAEFDVTILARNKNSIDVHSQYNGYSIRRLPALTSLPKPIRKAMQVSLWINPVWVYTYLKTIYQIKPSIIIIRDLPLLPLAVLAKAFNKIPVIYDMAECYPLMYESSNKYGSNSLASRIIKSQSISCFFERMCLSRCSHTWVMIEESLNRAISIAPRKNAISIVSNTPELKDDISLHKHEGEEIRLAYVGFITKIRGLDLLIRAIKLFVDHPLGGRAIKFDIVGKGEYRDQLIGLVKQLDLQDVISIHGWLSHDQAAQIMENANVGALTYRVCSHWNHTIPNKIFDYMMHGIPVLSTNVVPISRILRQEDCGLVATEEPESICAHLVQLKDSKLRDRLGENGAKAVKRQYNWKNEKEVISRTVNSLITMCACCRDLQR